MKTNIPTRRTMRRAAWRVLLRLSLTCLSLLFVTGPAYASTVAIVTDLSGGAWQVVQGRKTPLQILDTVAADSDLGVDGAGRLVLTFVALPIEYELSGPSRATVRSNLLEGTRGIAPTSRPIGVGDQVPYRLDTSNLAQASVVMRSGGGSLLSVRLMAPLGVNVNRERPLFEWSGPGGPYEIVVRDASGTVVHEGATDKSRYRLPKNANLRAGMIYTWQVQTRGKLGRAQGAWAQFGLIGRLERARIAQMRPSENAPFSQRVAFGVLLWELGLFDDASARFRILLDERPDAQGLRRFVR